MYHHTGLVSKLLIAFFCPSPSLRTSSCQTGTEHQAGGKLSVVVGSDLVTGVCFRRSGGTFAMVVWCHESCSFDFL
jgi:hypothetical protein